jgi:hypothetical protein
MKFTILHTAGLLATILPFYGITLSSRSGRFYRLWNPFYDCGMIYTPVSH